MIGTIINGAAILAGGALGLAVGKELSHQTQTRIKIGLGVFIVYVGLSTTWKAVNGSFGQILGQLGLIMLALVLGNVIGKLLRLQKRLNELAQFAKTRWENSPAAADGASRQSVSDGFLTCTLLFCVGPMAILGALQDGSTGNYKILAIKSVMDGLATMAFSKTFGWGVMLSAIPVVAYQGSWTLAARLLAVSDFYPPALDAMNATGGLLICTISLVVLELKKVPLADYLPSLAVAPLLAWLLR